MVVVVASVNEIVKIVVLHRLEPERIGEALAPVPELYA